MVVNNIFYTIFTIVKLSGILSAQNPAKSRGLGNQRFLDADGNYTKRLYSPEKPN
jgi:hypothetical protein